MNVILVAVSVLLFITLVLIMRAWYIRIKLKQVTLIKYNAMKVLILKLSSGAAVSGVEIIALARTPSLRLSLYRILEEYDRAAMFPEEFYTEEKGAESHLVTWLEFPTELGRSPDEIQLLKNVTLDELKIHYYVFQFRSSAPRWANQLGWMLGVCGPYDDRSLPFDLPEKIFSRFNPVGLIQPEAEVQWVHQQINV